MPDTEQSIDLSPLDSDYRIVGELGTSNTRRTLLAERKTDDAKRRDDHTGVVISVYSTPEGDEANALSHLAADTKTLAATSHRRLVPIIEGKWLGDDHFAVVTQRLSDPSLTSRLASREVFSTVRIAAILRELNGLLEWGREQGLVHRVITGDGLFLEPRTDRVRVVFDVTPMHRVRPSDETRDARTIARLAMTMLTGVEDPDRCNVEDLHDLRPELPARLGSATAELLDVKNASTKTDIVNYIALIGMSDPLYRGEEEEKRIRAEILEEQRVEREKLANERTEFETMSAKERADFAAQSAKERADFQAASTKERADFASFMEKERAKVESERLSLQKLVAEERAKLQKAIEKERAELASKRAELEKSVAEQKAELERAAALDRKKLDELRAELKRRGEEEIERKRVVALEDVHDSSETELDAEELATPLFVGPNLVPIEPLTFSESNDVLENEPVVFEPERAEPDPEPERLVTVESVKPVERKSSEATTRNRWLIPGAIGGGVAVVGLILLAIFTHGSNTPPTPPAATKTVATRQVVAPQPQAPAAPQWAVPLPAAGVATAAPVTDSAAGTIAPRADSVVAAPDSAALARAAAARAAARATRLREAQLEAKRQEARRATQSEADSIFNFRPPVTARPDSARPPRDSVARVKRDSVIPPDTGKFHPRR